LNVLLVQGGAVVGIILEVLAAKELGTGITFHWEVVKLMTRGLGTMLSNVRKFHCLVIVYIYVCIQVTVVLGY